MTPKEKAWVIMCEINNGTITKEDWAKISPYSKKELLRKCLYVVNEIIKSRPSLPIEAFGGSINLGECINLSINFWQDVKKELELL